MINRNHLLNLLLCGSLLIGTSIGVDASAQNKDVDQADTLDFESFHKDKKEAVKVWDKSSTTTKAYQDQPAANATTAPSAVAAPAPASPAAVDSPQTKSLAAAVTGSPSKRFEIRERYTLTRSTKTPYSAFYVIEPMYKQAAQLCPKGWKKLTEKSEPIEQDFYLYYEIECL